MTIAEFAEVEKKLAEVISAPLSTRAEIERAVVEYGDALSARIKQDLRKEIAND